MMAKTKTTPRAAAEKPVTVATKRPEKTKQFLTDVKTAITTFDDQISSLDRDVRGTAYNIFSMAYKEAFSTIWPKINDASVKTVLKSVQDTDLHEFRCMTSLITPQKSQPKIVREPHQVPMPEDILGSLVSHLPAEKLPDQETCSLISTVFKDLAEAHTHLASAARGLADVASVVSPQQLTLVLAAVVLPTLQLVLPLGQILPLSVPPPPPTETTTATGKQDVVKHCK